MTGLGDLVGASTALIFLRCLPSGSSLGSRAALCRLFLLLDKDLPPSTSSAPPSLARCFLFFLFDFWSDPRVASTLPLAASSKSERPVLEPLEDSWAGCFAFEVVANSTILLNIRRGSRFNVCKYRGWRRLLRASLDLLKELVRRKE